VDRILGSNCSSGDVSISGVDRILVEFELRRSYRHFNPVLQTTGGLHYRRHARCNGGDSGIRPIFTGYHRGRRIIHGRGAIILNGRCKNLKVIFDGFIYISLKKYSDNRFYSSGLIALDNGAKMEIGTLKEIRGAC